MPTAKIRNARKSFNWKVIIAGIDQFSIQKVVLPKKSIQAVEHGDTNYNVKSPGKIEWSDMELEKLMSHLNPDNDIWQWMLSAQSSTVGGGLPAGYERIITLIELAPDGITTLNTHIITCWPIEVEHGPHSRPDDAENIMEKVKFAVNGYDRI